MTRSWLTAACAVVVASVALAACGDDETAAPAGADQRATADGYPVTVRNCGRTLTFDEAPSRVVLNYHPEVEIFVGLGLAERAIGRAGYEGALKEPPLLREQAAAIRAIPVLSEHNYPPPKEKLLTLRPDFVLAYGIFDFGGRTEGKPGLATLKELEAAGAKSYLVTCPDGPKDTGAGYGTDRLESSFQAILDVGRIFGVGERAQRRVAQMKAQIADVREKVSADRLKVLAYGGGKGPIQVAGGGGIITELLDAAGGENVFAEDKQFFEASLESVAAKPADAFLIFADYEQATSRLDGADESRLLFKTFPNMPASKDKRFAVSDYMYTSPGWRVAQTAEDLARQLHPDAFDTPSHTQQHTDVGTGG